MRKKRVLVLCHEDLVPPESLEGQTNKQIAAWRTEFDVVHQLRQLGHDVHVQGVHSDLAVLRSAIEEFRPHITFNLLEEFHGVALYDQHVVSYLELMRTPYTGCNPRGLTLAHDKALSKKVLAYHRVPTPRFAVVPLGRSLRPPTRLEYPLFVKSAVEDASLGISQASVVHDYEELRARVTFVHEQVGTDALIEEYVDGRELYIGVIGNLRLQTLPIWEMEFTSAGENTPRIATAKVKWDEAYQEKIGLEFAEAKNLPSGAAEMIARLGKRVYRALELSGYARMDLRMTQEGRIYVIEANPNPDLSLDDLFAESAHKAGVPFGALITRILNLGLRYRAGWQGERE